MWNSSFGFLLYSCHLRICFLLLLLHFDRIRHSTNRQKTKDVDDDMDVTGNEIKNAGAKM